MLFLFFSGDVLLWITLLSPFLPVNPEPAKLWPNFSFVLRLLIVPNRILRPPRNLNQISPSKDWYVLCCINYPSLAFFHVYLFSVMSVHMYMLKMQSIKDGKGSFGSRWDTYCYRWVFWGTKARRLFHLQTLDHIHGLW